MSCCLHLIAGGNLTGAIFNPALAFSLHADCFYDKFLSYSLVYWLAPCLGKFLILYMFEKVLFSTWFINQEISAFYLRVFDFCFK